MDGLINDFNSVTGSIDRDQARQYLQVTEGNLEQAVALYFETGGIDLESRDRAPRARTPPPPARSLRPLQPNYPTHHTGPDGVISIDSDEEEFADIDDDEPIVVPERTSSVRAISAQPDRGGASALSAIDVEDDEAVARRLQEQIYAGDGRQSPLRDGDGVRAPIARTTETLVGPDGSWGGDDGMDVRAAIQAQLAARQNRGRPGIFNQHHAPSVWSRDPNSQRAELAQATGGASEISSKASSLAEMYRPPFEIISKLSLEKARDEGREQEKWILINVQDSAIFDCQVLNRDLWKNPSIMETVRENFIFLQFEKSDPKGAHYYQYYFQQRHDQDAYPHISILDPRTGEQVKTWSGPPPPKAPSFLNELHEFLDRYSLAPGAKNPVTKPTPRPVNTDSMTEEEQLELAMKNSMASAATGTAGPSSNGTSTDRKGKARAVSYQDTSTPTPVTDPFPLPSSPPPSSTPLISPFSLIPSHTPHIEPPAGPESTRIQFRHSGGRVIRRFRRDEPVRRLYEWLKAEPLEGRSGEEEFELVVQGRNLLAEAESSVAEAGLVNQTVMVEFV
ncbi:MAG: hypothetical protein M1814_004565 [Vezdaea aestivalis]|nr:MAG: hypothetical protein M1814_004565 [Vezdaea aestivalis]